jgi:DNA-directed RNA polymerase specialized sigma24 family protein
LYRIAVNVSLNYVGVKRPIIEPVEPERLFDQRSESSVEIVARGERSAKVMAAIARLPGKQRVTLVLRVYRDLTHCQIAEILENSVVAVKANFFHALANLRKQLAATSR